MDEIKLFGYFIAGAVILGIFTFIVVRYIVNKTLDGLESNKDKITNLEKSEIVQDQKIKHLETDVIEYKKIVNSSIDFTKSLNETIQKLDANTKNQHQEMKAVLESNTKVMHEVLQSLKK